MQVETVKNALATPEGQGCRLLTVTGPHTERLARAVEAIDAILLG